MEYNGYLSALPLIYHVVRYEDLVENFNTEADKLIGFLGLEWNGAVLEYAEHAKKRGRIHTASYDQVTGPIYQRAKYRWQTLQPYIDYFGYSEPEMGGKPRGSEWIEDKPAPVTKTVTAAQPRWRKQRKFRPY